MIENGSILKAEEGHFLTNGETFAKIVSLGKYDSVNNWTEITEAEKQRLENEATTEDLYSALARLGVE